MNSQEKTLESLFAFFDNRKGVEYSDCYIVGQILAHFTQGEDPFRDKRVMDWVIERIRNPSTIPLVKSLLKRFFEDNKTNLSQEEREVFERAIQENEFTQDIPKLLKREEM